MSSNLIHDFIRDKHRNLKENDDYYKTMDNIKAILQECLRVNRVGDRPLTSVERKDIADMIRRISIELFIFDGENKRQG